MGCCDNLIKSLLFVFNFLCVGCGAIILGLGIWSTVSYGTLDRVTESSLTSPPVVMIVIGSVILLVAILGCFGACCDNQCMLVSYSILLLLLFVAQVAVGILIIVNGQDVGEPVKRLLQKEFDNAAHDQASYDFYQNLQKSIKCCGVTSYADYLTNLRVGPLYQSCCKPETKFCPLIPDYKTGCVPLVAEFIEGNSKIFGGVAIGIAVIEVLGAIAGFATANYVKRTT